MRKVRISLTGKWADNQTWDIVQQGSSPTNAYLYAEMGPIMLQVCFDDLAEYARFNDGIGLCRARVTLTMSAHATLSSTVYLTAFNSTKKK